MSQAFRALAALFLSTAAVLAAAPLHAQSADPGAYRVGERVEVEYVPGSGRWVAAQVVEVLNDGFSYRVSIAPGQDAAESQTNIHFRRVRAATPAPAAAPGAPAAPAAPPQPGRGPSPGRYACTESRYDASTGGYRYDARGSFTLSADGRYQYSGFTRPSAGRYSASAGGTVTFRGGYLAGGEATPIEGRPGRYYLTAPGIGSRWTCGAA